MPNFNYGPNYLAGYQSVFQPITAFQQGRANKLAYETELQQQDVRAQELAGLEYANRPDVRAAAAEHQAATTDYMKAQTEVMRRPAPYEPPDYIKGAEYYWEPPRFPGDSPRRTQIPVPKTASGTTVNVGSKDTEITKGIAKQVLEQGQKARTAVQRIQGIGRAINILDKGNVITGTLADFRLDVTRAMATLGLTSPNVVANTEALIAETGKETARVLGSGDFGTGTGLSDADRLYATLIAGADINLSAEGMRKILDMGRRVALADIRAYNSRVREMRESENPRVRADGMALSLIEEPLVELIQNPRPIGQGWQKEADWMKREYPGLSNDEYEIMARQLGILK